MHPTRILFAALLALILLQAPALAVDATESISLDSLKAADGSQPDKVDDGVHIAGNSKYFAPKKYTTPLTIRAVLMTDSNNIRLCFGDKGLLVLTWTNDKKTLRFCDPRDGTPNDVPNQGMTAKNKYISVLWTFDEKQVTVYVNNTLRATFPGNYANLTEQVGVATGGTANVTIKYLDVMAPQKSPVAARNAVTNSTGEVIDVSVPTGPHATTLPAAPANPDPDAIERPQFQDTPKPLLKNLTSITSMMVTIDDDGTEHGITNDIIATVPATSRQSDSAGIGFISHDGDSMMKVALQEAVRAINIRYPIWEHGHIDLSFGEKFVAHGGPSAGTAFGVLMLSILEGFSIDPKCAVTGDITVDWKVRKIGGVTAKLHGATLDNCLYAAIPEDNASALPDLALLYGNNALYDVQIFSIATLQDAVAITRKDRDPQLAQAIKEFADLQSTLTSDKTALKSTSAQSALKHILTLAPNHISAKYLLAISQGTAPKHLSSAATLHQLSAIIYPYIGLFQKSSTLTGEGTIHLSPAISALSRKRISDLRPLLSPEFAPLLQQLSAFVETSAGLANHSATLDPLKTRIDSLRAALTTVTTDKDFAETLSREGF